MKRVFSDQEISHLEGLLNQGLVSDYYQFQRGRRGYAEIAVNVPTRAGFASQLALSIVEAAVGPERAQEVHGKVALELAYSDLEVIKERNGALPQKADIESYHARVFENNGIPKTAFGGASFAADGMRWDFDVVNGKFFHLTDDEIQEFHSPEYSNLTSEQKGESIAFFLKGAENLLSSSSWLPFPYSESLGLELIIAEVGATIQALAYGAEITETGAVVHSGDPLGSTQFVASPLISVLPDDVIRGIQDGTRDLSEFILNIESAGEGVLTLNGEGFEVRAEFGNDSGPQITLASYSGGVRKYGKILFREEGRRFEQGFEGISGDTAVHGVETGLDVVTWELGVEERVYRTLGATEVAGLSNGDFGGNFDDGLDSGDFDGGASGDGTTNPGIPDGAIIGAAVGQVGSLLTDRLVEMFADDSAALEIAGRALGSTLTSTLSKNLAKLGKDSSARFDVSASSIAQGTVEAGVGLVGNLVGSEIGGKLADSLGINEGLGTLVGGTIGRVTVNQVAAHIAIQNGAEMFGVHQAVNAYGEVVLEAPSFTEALSSALPAAVGSYAGSWLANEIFDLNPKGAQIGGTLGSLGGSLIASNVSAAALGFTGAGASSSSLMAFAATNPYAAVAVAAVFFATTFLGTSVGGLLGGKPSVGPLGHSNVRFRDEHFLVDGWGTDNGGDEGIVVEMGQAAASIMNTFIAKIGGRVANIHDNHHGYGYDRTGYFWGHGGTDDNWSLPHYGSAEAALEAGVLHQMRNTQIEGGDVYLKRALYRSNATTLSELDRDLTAALDWSFFKTDQTTFLQMVEEGGDEALARWQDSQARATALNLDGGDSYAFSRATYLETWEAEQEAIRNAAYDFNNWVYEEYGPPRRRPEAAGRLQLRRQVLPLLRTNPGNRTQVRARARPGADRRWHADRARP